MNNLEQATAYRLAAQWSELLGLPMGDVTRCLSHFVVVSFAAGLAVTLRRYGLWHGRVCWDEKRDDVLVTLALEASAAHLHKAEAFMPTLLGMVPADVVEAARREMGQC